MARRGFKKRGLWTGLKGKTMPRPRHGSTHLCATPLGVPRSLGRAAVTPVASLVLPGIRIYSDNLWVRNCARVSCYVAHRSIFFPGENFLFLDSLEPWRLG